MHIPPYHKQPGWQRFFAGAFFGGLIAYMIFLFMYGTMQADFQEEHLALKAETAELKRQNTALLEDNQNLDEKSKEEIGIDSIDIAILNSEEMKFDRLLGHQLTELVREEVDQIIGAPIGSVAENADLLVSTIENKTYEIDDFSYKLEVRRLTIYKKVHIAVHAKFKK
ncbi:hypothetical protein QR721_09005 [Aciduricibacillus chroicocephali]|uniref:Sporulation membrane protein YtrI C-terminal domain-containing protein n=1 Tax=Aciduricibacillus chroicocephali TaxID=3054939 RepID=A0ABY9KTB1_9BACI|nr:hypothetical protein QR721_09005 [Bacillaceae bacterium 44XB]